jgi:hypothetical protein
MGQLGDDFAILVDGADAELLSVLAVLAEQEPDEGIEDGGLSASVSSGNCCCGRIEIDHQIGNSLEIDKMESAENNSFHS